MPCYSSIAFAAFTAHEHKGGKLKKSEVINKVDPKRRDAMRKILASGFSAPVVSSFAMTVLSIKDASAQSSNTTEWM